jgi:putative Mg2+ transporter-C (MgtC) family protein
MQAQKTRRKTVQIELLFRGLSNRQRNITVDTFFRELSAGMPDMKQLALFTIRLTAAILFGGLIGIQRERRRQWAGLRTHMLVAMGSALFVSGSVAAGMALSDLSRVVQGLAAGIGFIGGGTILKLSQEHTIRGITTAASIWMTAAVGVAAGLGLLGLGLIAAVFTLIILAGVGVIERRIETHDQSQIELGGEKPNSRTTDEPR